MNAEKTGKFISELRRENNLTQQDLANLLFVSDKAVSRWETGRGLPDINNLEALAKCFKVTVAELIKGEKLQEPVSREDLETISTDSMTLTKALLSRRRYVNILLGFLISLALVTATAVHLMSPIYFEGDDNAVTIEELPGGMLVGVLSEDVTGCEVSDVINQPLGQGRAVFVSCYKTRLDQLLNKRPDNLVMIGLKEEVNMVYYFPSSIAGSGGTGGDQLIYKSENAPDISGGVETLPRLLYNFWLMVGAAASVIGIVLLIIFRKKYFAPKLLKIVALPVCFTVSTVLCLMGHFNEVYNASFYFSGIVVLAITLYLLFWLILSIRGNKVK